MLLKGMLPGISAHSTFTLAASNQNMHVCLITQSCPTLCDPKDCSPPGSSVHGILQARILEWVAISFSNAGKGKVKGKLLSRVRLLATPRTAAHQAPLSMGFSRQEYWSGWPLPSPVIIISSQIIEPMSKEVADTSETNHKTTACVSGHVFKK